MHYIFFQPDEMRAKSLSCYGNKLIKTPNFERLASQGVLFENTYTQHPVSLASRCAMMTGWYPHVQGFRTLQYDLESYHPNFIKYIKDAGYQIHMYGKNIAFSDRAWSVLADVNICSEDIEWVQTAMKDAKKKLYAIVIQCSQIHIQMSCWNICPILSM